MSDRGKDVDLFDGVDERLAQFFEMSDEEIADEHDSLYIRIRDLDERYSPIETIAVGGMKEISRVYDARADRFVAMAQLLPDAPEDLYEPFLREACLTARLEHPNIINVYNIGVNDEGRPFFTMELKVGDSLSDILKKLNAGSRDYMRRYPLEELLEIFMKICDAMAYAHAQGVVHLDLKPSNVQVAPYGEVKVCDWGLGRFLDPNAEQRNKRRLHVDLLNTIPPFGAARGTPGYMAPEQVERGASVSYQTDIYSLGVILYTILALKDPFSSEDDVHAIMQKTLIGEIPPLPHMVPLSLRSVVEKCMSHEPGKRYANVEELRMEIRRYIDAFPTTAESAGMMRRARLFYKRNRRICRTGLVGLLSVVCVAILFEVALIERNRRALAARLAAIESKQLYEQEKDAAADMKREFSGELKFMSWQFSTVSSQSAPADEYIYNELLRRLEMAGDLNPSDAQSRVGRGIILFTLQRFNEAAEVLETTPNWAWAIRELAQQYGQKKADDQRLSAEAMASLIRELRERSRRPSTILLIDRMSAYDLSRREDLSECAVVVEALLEVYSEGWSEHIYRYDAGARHLILGGKGLWDLKSDRLDDTALSPLRWLRLHTLELRGMGFSMLQQLNDLSVVRLDLRDVSGSVSADVFQNFLLISEIVVRPGRMSEPVRNELPSHISVVELPESL
ncbi:serine/threonine-protein kinase [Pontiella sulfatireligans]|uniref:Serine/threonine-protein kinase PknD n=1 Tax=Pontiella sulfatireligans TaxID=2750658 RepID=A0A6C2UKN8_9BACT|nr:serine/threonine-protein kinase [Pontiella sulfatireligans]VGO20802.1 Serine/threonine-protein kinase PknD [Pontiella sulfatireligans]